MMRSPTRDGRRSHSVVALVSLVGLLAFGWPLVAQPDSVVADRAVDAPLLFALLLPLLLAVAAVAMIDGGLDARRLAMLGVLAAMGAALRPLGAGMAGVEPMWIIIILGARALGSTGGFLLGGTSMFVSGFITGGIGPWLPFQMLAAAWLGWGAGALPQVRGRWSEPALLACYAFIGGVAFGLLMNLWMWPWTPGLGPTLSYSSDAGVPENVQRWIRYSVATSMAWDLMRGMSTAVLVALTHRPVLVALRRGARRAHFLTSPARIVPTASSGASTHATLMP